MSEPIKTEVKEEMSVVLLDGLDSAKVHLVAGPEGKYFMVYDPEKIIDVLVQRDGMDEEEAWEFFFFNIEPLGSLDNGPLFLVESYLNEVLEEPEGPPEVEEEVKPFDGAQEVPGEKHDPKGFDLSGS